MSWTAEERNQQRRDALKVANSVRSAKALLKRRLQAGELDPVPIIRGEQDDAWARFGEDLRLGVFLRAIRGIGSRSADSIMREAGVYSDDRLRTCTNEQREALSQLVMVMMGRSDELIGEQGDNRRAAHGRGVPQHGNHAGA